MVKTVLITGATDGMHFLILKTFSQPQEITSHLNPLDTKHLIRYFLSW